MSITLTRPTKVVNLVTNLGLVAEHDATQAAFDEARNLDVTDPREVPRAPEAARAVQAVEARMKDSTLRFTLQAEPRSIWSVWEATHPPVKGDPVDEQFRLHVADLDEVIARSIISVTDHEGAPVDFDPRTEWVPLADSMTQGQWEDFALAVMGLNRGVKETPFSASASRTILLSERTSKPQNDVGSASSD